MDYLLAAHIQVTGGADAANQLNMVANAVSRLNSTGSGTGGMAGDLDKASQSSSGLAAGLSRVGDAVIRMATYQGIRFVEEGLRSAGGAVLDFNSAMTESLAIQTGVTSQMRGQMEDLAKSIAVSLGTAPNDVAEGFYYLASAGLNVEQQMADLPIVANFAKAGMMDLDSATEMLFDSLTALGLKVDDPAQQMANLAHLSDLLTEAAIKSQGSIEDFGSALSNKAGGIMKAYGIDLNEGIGLLEVFADRGIKGARGGEAFNQIIRDMALKAIQHADAFKRMGIEVFDAGGNFNSLVTIFGQVDAALGGLSDAERVQALHQLGFTQRNMTLIQGLIGTSGQLKENTEDLKNAGGVAERVANTQMESLRSKLNQLKSISMVFAIEGFEKIEQAAAWLVSTFSPAVEAVVDVLGQLAAGAAPVAGALGGLVATGVVKGLEGIARAIEIVFTAISQHQGLVQGFGVALAGIGALHIAGAITDIATAIGANLIGRLSAAREAINLFIVNLQNIRAVEGVFAAVRSGFGSLLQLLSSPLVIGAGIGLLIYQMVDAFNDGKNAAKEFSRELERKYDTKTLAGVTDAATDAGAHLEYLRGQFKGLTDGGLGEAAFNILGTTLDTITPKFFNFGNNIFKMRGEFEQAKDEAERWKAAQANIADGFSTIDQAFKGVAGNAFVLNPLTDQLMGVAREAAAAGVAVDTTPPALARLAAANNIDLTGPYEEWAPLLAEAAVGLERVRGTAEQMGGVAAGTGTEMSSMEKAIETLGDKAADAESKLDALKTVMDGLSGGQQNLFDMTSRYHEALAELSTSLSEATPSFDALTEAGRNQRDKLSEAADAARDLALANAETSGDMQAGAVELTNYANGVADVLRNAQVAEPVIQALLQQMGLTPEQINTLFNITTTPGEPEATNQKLEETAGPRDAPITAVPVAVPETAAAFDGATAPRTAPALMVGNWSAAELGFNDTARHRSAPATMNADWADAEIGFDTTARFRPAPSTMDGSWSAAELGFNNTARHRSAPSTMDGSWSAAELGFNNTARHRPAPATMNAETGGAEGAFNRTARDRSSTATAFANTGSAEAALNALAQDRYATVHVNVAVTGNTSFNTGQLADGGVIHPYASGGFENHGATIARANTPMRLWNEPETGGEAYIPLAMSKRDRSLAVWEETGRLLGATNTTRNVNVNVPINVSVDGAGDPTATAQAVAGHVKQGVDAALSRVLIELRSV